MGCCKNKCNSPAELTDEESKILTAMEAKNEPWSSKDIAAASFLGSKTVSDKLKRLKAGGLVDSPARCKYILTEIGRAAASSGRGAAGK